MKAKDLIKILEKYPELDVKIYNGFDDDIMDIKCVDEEELVRDKPKNIIDIINKQNKILGKPKINSLKVKRKYTVKNKYINYNDNKNNYDFKKIFLIEPKGSK